MQIKTTLATLFLAATAFLGASCQQQRPYPIYFLTQADGIEDGAKAVVMCKGVPYTRMPILSHNNISKFRSFLAEDGSYGAEFFLKPEYRKRLEHICYEFRGRKLLPVINGLVFEPQRIDRPVYDGVLIIWSGLNGYDLKRISKNIDPVNPDIEKARYKDKNPRVLPPRPKHANQMKDHNGRTIGELYVD